MGSFPQDTALPSLLQSGSFLWTKTVHKVLQNRLFAQSTVLQEQIAPVWVLCRPQFLWANLLQWGLHLGCSFFCDITPSCSLESSMGCSLQLICSTHMCSMGYRRLTCTATFCSLGCRGISALTPINTYSPSYTDLGVCGVVSTFFVSCLSPLFHSWCAAFSTLYKVHLYKDTPSMPALISFDYWWVHFRASWNWLSNTGTARGCSHRGHQSLSPCAPKLVLPCL